MKSILLIASLSAGSAVACAAPPPPARADRPQTVATLARVETTTVPGRFEAGGVVRARLTAPIAARVLAPIVGMRVRPGDRVRKGDVLITLDGRDLQAQAERAAAALVAAQQSVRAAEADKQGADAGLILATAAYDRIDGLHAKRSATNQEFDEAAATLQAAKARVAGAEARRAEGAAALTAEQAATNVARIAASYATIGAPFDGVVTERFADPGTMAAPATPLLTIEDTSAFRLEVRIDGARAGQVAVGQTVDVRLDSAPTDSWSTGRIAEVARLDAAGHGFVLKIDLPSSATYRSGTFARARFAGPSRSALSVPAAAVIRRGQLTFVFVVEDDSVARLRPVTLGGTFGDRVEVLAGVSDGAEIVVHPSPSLNDGTPIARGGRR